MVRDISVDPTVDLGIWFGTFQEGVSYFNGTEWINYNVNNSPLQSNRMNTLEVDANGNVWLGVKTNSGPYSNTGLVKFDGTNWEYHLRSADVLDIDFDNNGDLWLCAVSNGVYHYKNNTEWEGYFESDGLLNSFVTALDFAENGRLFIGTIEGVSIFDGSGWTSLVVEGGLKGDAVTDITFDTENNVWVGTSWGGVNVFNGSNWQYYTSKSGLAGDWVMSIAIDKDGRKWFATNTWGGEGITVLEGSNFVYYTTLDGLSDNWINDIEIDRNNKLWFGAGRTWSPNDEGGVSSYDGSNWTIYNTDDGLADKVVQTVFVASDGRLWFGTQNGGISVFDGDNWTTYNTANGLASNEVRDIAQDNNGRMWIATWGGGLNVFDGVGWQVHNTSNGLVSDYISTVLVDRQSNVWIGTDNYGVGKYDGNNWEFFTTDDGLPTNGIQTLALDNIGNLWIGGWGSSLSRVLVNILPVANAGPDKTAFAKRSTAFDGSLSYDLDGSIVSYTWDLDSRTDSNDDGNFINDVDATGQTINWTFDEPGEYLVTLTVVDDKGSKATDQLVVSVTEPTAGIPFVEIDQELLDNYVAIGLEEAFFKEKAVVTSGNIGSNGDVTFGVNTNVTADVSAGSDMRLKEKAVVDGDVVYAGELDLGHKSVITGSVTQTLPDSLHFSVSEFSAGGQSFIVKQKESLNLAPGSYDKLQVKAKGELTLSSGSYFFNTFDIGTDVNIRLDLTAGPLYVYIVEQLEIGEKSEMRIVSASGEPSQVFFIILGRTPNGRTGTSFIGVNVKFLGTVIAPASELLVKEKAEVNGALYAKILTVGVNATVTFSGADSPVMLAGAGSTAGSAEVAQLPKAFALNQNYPNPFNPSTTIFYSIPDGESISTKLEIYNIRGQLVSTLVSGVKAPGYYQVMWDGTDRNGMRVTSGVYFYRLTAGDFMQTRKMVILK